MAQALAPGMSVAQVARRYDLNANQVFNWARDPRFRPSGEAITEAPFLPVEIIDSPPPDRGRPLSSSSIEIALANGHRLRVTGEFDPEAVARLARSLGA